MKLEALKRHKLFVILRNLIIAEVFVYLAFMALALSADWGEIYEKSTLAKYSRFEILEFLFLGLFQLAVIIFVFARSVKEESDIHDMIKSGEHERLEFKTSLRWDSKRSQVNKELEKSIMKTITAFLNSEGGHLVIGVDDNGGPVGIENDFASLPKPTPDGFENHFNNLFSAMVGPEFRQLVRIKFDNLDDKTICLVSVESSHKPAYLKAGDSEDFYIRTGNVTTPLKMSEVATYISSWWEG